ncbi:MAG: type II toxin-antitoxin system death-on-curing family toxin [Gammaproteobacteria bacterium]|nr:MAG: type II toxin-antitoxin system death-on-curing family toxin [Gammaproteobacteria bacterium]
MKNPRWVPARVVLALHKECIATFGGSDGVRDEGLLESALARPENLLSYGAPTMFELAAAYGYGIAKNHPFIDGNKRTAFLATAVFLMDNGFQPLVSEADVVNTITALAAGQLTETGFAQWLKQSFKPVKKRPVK